MFKILVPVIQDWSVDQRAQPALVSAIIVLLAPLVTTLLQHYHKLVVPALNVTAHAIHVK